MPPRSVPAILRAVSGTHVGQLAALGAASCWAVSPLAFEAAGRRMGALTLNMVRLLLAALFLAVATGIATGRPLPLGAPADAWLWLSLSGLVGFVFGDVCLFRSILLIGPRLAMLLLSLAPPFAALLAWIVLGETLSLRDLCGMTLVVAGIAWAVLERRQPAEEGAPPVHPTATGVLLGVGGAFGQAGGLILSKRGMGALDAIAATEMRVLAAVAGYALLFFALRWWPRLRRALADRTAIGYAAIGAFFGPVLGVTLSLVAIRNTSSGVAASLMATTPILIIPAVVLVRRERVGLGGVAGAAVAVAGVVLLFLWG